MIGTLGEHSEGAIPPVKGCEGKSQAEEVRIPDPLSDSRRSKAREGRGEHRADLGSLVRLPLAPRVPGGNGQTQALKGRMLS